MTWLIDTGILLRLVNRSDPNHANIRRALRELKDRGDALVVTAQNLVEFWNVCSRPASARGGYGLSLEATERKLRLIERLFNLLPDTVVAYYEWRQLAVNYRVSGVQVHDARIVAAMRVHRVANILTENVVDFLRYDGITAITPKAMVERASI